MPSSLYSWKWLKGCTVHPSPMTLHGEWGVPSASHPPGAECPVPPPASACWGMPTPLPFGVCLGGWDAQCLVSHPTPTGVSETRKGNSHSFLAQVCVRGRHPGSSLPGEHFVLYPLSQSAHGQQAVPTPLARVGVIGGGGVVLRPPFTYGGALEGL